MTAEAGRLITEAQIALGLTQQQLADRLGKNRRTIQRWQDQGTELQLTDAQVLADLLRPVRPDLADRVVELGQQTAAKWGAAVPHVPASPEQITAILEAAAQAAGMPIEGIRAVVTAAFDKASQIGVDVDAVLEGLQA